MDKRAGARDDLQKGEWVVTLRTLLIVGNDKISRRAQEIARNEPHVVVAVDKSTNLKRVGRLIWRGSLSIGLLLRMAFCEWRRVGEKMRADCEVVRTNTDVLRLADAHKPERILLFRAGLIVNRAVLSTGIPIMNIHCARLPEYGGIGTIARALRDGAFEQCATLHHVTKSIDQGNVLDTEAYRLNPKEGYCRNEWRAYEAGLRLLRRNLSVQADSLEKKEVVACSVARDFRARLRD